MTQRTRVFIGTLLACALVESNAHDGVMQPEALRPVFQTLCARRFGADIYGAERTRVELRLVIVDRQGTVIFDSMNRAVGQDHSQWRDIRLALQGQYGAHHARCSD